MSIDADTICLVVHALPDAGSVGVVASSPLLLDVDADADPVVVGVESAMMAVIASPPTPPLTAPTPTPLSALRPPSEECDKRGL